MNRRRDRLILPIPGIALLASAPARAAEGGLEIVPDGTILVLLLVAFTLLVYPVHVLLFRPIFRVLDAREEKISGTRRRAERVAAEAELMASRYENTIAESRREIDRERSERLEVARRESASEAAGAREAAEREIEAARSQLRASVASARASLESQAQELARAAAARLLGRPL